MLAILGALLEDNDVESRLPANEFSIEGERTDMEISRVGTYACVSLRIPDVNNLGLRH